jgi:ribA/ribD-fused uncharacterized protein
MLDRPTLINRIAAGEQFTRLFFWGHTVPKDGKVGKTCFSQWYPTPFTVDGILYPTAEHWMMAAKARLFNDDSMLEQILSSPDPKTAKALGRLVSGFDDEVWKANARRLVVEGNVAKFSQNPAL